MKWQMPRSVWGLRDQGVELFGRSAALFSAFHDHLSFLNHVHEFDPDQGILGSNGQNIQNSFSLMAVNLGQLQQEVL